MPSLRRKLKQPGRLIIISGPSGSGKTTLHKRLLLNRKFKNRLVKSISATTRSPREGERNKKDYIFLKEEDFIRKISKHYFLEFQKVFNHYYGTPKNNVLRLLRDGKHVLLCIDVKGAKSVWSEFPNVLKVFITVPSIQELKRRLTLRASEKAGKLFLRLKRARFEMKEARHYDYVIVNANLESAYRRLEKVISREIF